LIVAVAIFSVVLIGVVFAHLFGLSMFRITENTLSTTDDTRQVISRLAQEVRASRTTSIGNVTAGTFTGLLDGEQQRGSALLIRTGTNTANFVVYFVNNSDQTLRRTLSPSGVTTILAESITNALAFSARDYAGTVLTNNQLNGVIHINLEFYQPRRFKQVADYYKLETSVTRRSSLLP
jgi:hypothetical protein